METPQQEELQLEITEEAKEVLQQSQDIEEVANLIRIHHLSTTGGVYPFDSETLAGIVLELQSEILRYEALIQGCPNDGTITQVVDQATSHFIGQLIIRGTLPQTSGNTAPALEEFFTLIRPALIASTRKYLQEPCTAGSLSELAMQDNREEDPAKITTLPEIQERLEKCTKIGEAQSITLEFDRISSLDTRELSSLYPQLMDEINRTAKRVVREYDDLRLDQQAIMVAHRSMQSRLGAFTSQKAVERKVNPGPTDLEAQPLDLADYLEAIQIAVEDYADNATRIASAEYIPEVLQQTTDLEEAMELIQRTEFQVSAPEFDLTSEWLVRIIGDQLNRIIDLAAEQAKTVELFPATEEQLGEYLPIITRAALQAFLENEAVKTRFSEKQLEKISIFLLGTMDTALKGHAKAWLKDAISKLEAEK